MSVVAAIVGFLFIALPFALFAWLNNTSHKESDSLCYSRRYRNRHRDSGNQWRR